ncbi:peptidoglycan DD-metalloendopeptidase family protein [uncultured Croceitalea sp.]|uniref:peptidoglycan DD-metalloendopeptidase family protein n=1 Tax=uncultured Croceitalea sp. TaxID=1798908 RepID=UPI0033062AC3
MVDLVSCLKGLAQGPIQILDIAIPLKAYCKIDLSSNNPDLKAYDITDPSSCQDYIDIVLRKNRAKVAYGGYLEERNLYTNAERFSEGTTRNIHLGMDFWCKAGTKVLVPLDGELHSFKNNDDSGNYGPTIILKHEVEQLCFYTLYGHLSLDSLQQLAVGKRFKKGESLATLGSPDINVNYAPHLHFQLIIVIEDYYGDYPGVCSSTTIDFYKNNCPDPNLLLSI